MPTAAPILGPTTVDLPTPQPAMLPNADTAFRPLLRDGRLKQMRAACLPAHGPHLACSLCVETCPVSALTLDDDATLTASEACLGCGRCVAACPTGALTASGFSLRALPGGSLSLDCERATGSANSNTRVRCLGGLTTEVLLELAGAQTQALVLDRGWCAACPASGGEEAPWAVALDQARTLLAEAGVAEEALPQRIYAPLPVRKAKPLDIEQVEEGRRALLRQAGVAREVPPPEETARGRRRDRLVPRAHHRRLKALRRVIERTEAPLPAALRTVVTVAEGCDGTWSCASFCPTGALSRQDEGESAALLTFTAADCIACGRCAEGCPSRAIRLAVAGEGEEPSPAPQTLCRFEMTRCRGCGAEFTAVPGEERCPSCRVTAGLFLSLGLFGGR